jgi:hypothetical protein
VLASLLVSILLIGMKLNAARDIAVLVERRKELKTNLLLLRRRVQDEDKDAWLDNIVHDTAQRQEIIDEIGPAYDQVHSTAERVTIDEGMAVFSQYDSSSAPVTQLKSSAAVTRSETKLIEAGRSLGRMEAKVCASPLEIIAYILNYDSHHARSCRDPAFDVFSKMVERVNDHHIITFSRKRFGAGLDRTFLSSVIATKVQAPATCLLVVVPIPHHPKITSKDEAGAVRAQSFQSFRFTEVAPGRTRMEYVCSLTLGACPLTLAIDMVSHSPETIQLYFQQLRPLSECDAEDGRAAGHLLKDLLESKPGNLELAIFSNRMAMLRDCGFRIAAFLMALTSAPDKIASPKVAAIPQDPAEEQAAAIGMTLRAAIGQPPVAAAAVRKAVDLHSVLRTVSSRYAWFVPMLEVLLVQAASSRRSTVVKRLRSIIAPAPDPAAEAPTEEHVATSAEGAGAVSFDPV